MLRAVSSIFFIYVLVVSTAWAHSLTWMGVEFDYMALVGGRGCCSDLQTECRPAYDNYRRDGGDFVIEFPTNPRNLDSTRASVRVAKDKVIWENLKDAGFAHVCVSYDMFTKKWYAHCVFIPPGKAAQISPALPQKAPHGASSTIRAGPEHRFYKMLRYSHERGHVEERFPYR